MNDDEEGGWIAAQRAASLVNGRGTVAILGVNPDVAGTIIGARTFEESLAQLNPGIRIVERRKGTFNVIHEQQVAEDTLRANPNLET